MENRFSAASEALGVGAAFGKMVSPIVAGTAFPPNLKLERQSANLRASFQVWGRHSWRESANEGLLYKLVFCCLMGARGGVETYVRCRLASRGCNGREVDALLSNPRHKIGYTCATSILETAEDATYSSLRRKKSHSQPGDSRLHARRAEWSTLASEAIFKQRALPFGWNLAEF